MANLLDKANILITPTAYGDGKIHSAKPIKSSSAEKVVNGDFATNSDWNLGNGWSISGDLLSVVNGNDYVTQKNVLGIGKSAILKVQWTQNITVGSRLRFFVRNYNDGGENGSTLSGSTTGSGGFSIGGNCYGSGTFTVFVSVTNGYTFKLLGEPNVNASIDNVSVKEVIDSDLNFTRGSAGTRANAQGLIENVDTLGVEKIINGDFATDSDWNKPSNLSISNGKAFANNVSSGQQLWQSFNSIGTYKIDFTISNYVIGEIRPIFHGGTHLGGENVSENGIFTQYLTATSAPSRFSFKFFGSSSIMCIDNVSVKEVIDVTNIPRINYKDFQYEDSFGIEEVVNGDFATDTNWAYNSNWSIFNGIATSNGTGLIQQLTSKLTNGKTHKASFEITEYISGGIKLYSGSGSDTSTYKNTVGTHVFYFVPNGTTTSLYSNNFIGSIDNVSVKEVTKVVTPNSGVGSWLLEPQSTNALIYSGNASQWVFGGNGYPNNTNRVDNQSSLDGETNASLFSRNTGTSGWFGTGNVSTINGQTYTHSLFVKKGTSSTIQIRNVNNNPQSRITYNIDTDIFTLDNNASANSVNYGNGWYRIEMTFEYTNANSSYSQIRHTLEDGKSMYVFGAQLEQQSFATSYIPTAATVQTRLAETASRSGLGDLIDSTQGVLYAEISALYDNSVNDLRWFSLNDNSTSNLVTIYYYKATNTIGAQLKVGGVQVFRNDDIPITSKTDFIKIAFKWKQDDVAIYINGIKKASSTSVNSFNSGVLNRFSFDRGVVGQDFYGKCKALAVFPILTDEELECLTTR